MELSLLNSNNISSSSSSNNNNINSSSDCKRITINNNNTIGDDIENNINDNTLRIDDDRTIIELIKEDRNLIIFFMILGFYIEDEKNTMNIKVLARLWQCCLIIFGGIGFITEAFVEGIIILSLLS